jgi:hypothetical protein
MMKCALCQAIKDGECLKNSTDIKKCFKEAFIDVDSLKPYWREILDIYCELERKDSPPPSPPTTPERSPSVGAYSNTESDQEPEDFSETTDAEGKFRICVFRPHEVYWDAIRAKRCPGKYSLITKAVVARLNLPKIKQQVVITWCHPGQLSELSRTLCYVVPDLPPSVDISLAENYGKDDKEEDEDEEEIAEVRAQAQPLGRQTSNINPPPARRREKASNKSDEVLSSAQEEKMLQNAAKMNHVVARENEIMKASQQLRLDLESDTVDARRGRWPMRK